MVSLGGSTVHDIEIVSSQNRVKVALVDDEQWDLGIELAEVTHLAVLLRDQSLGEHSELDEEVLFGEIEVGTESLYRYPALVPCEGKLERLVEPLVAVESKELREESLTGVGE
jgi:hypothetical protein